MDSPLGQALTQVRTNVQWATLPSVVAKMNARLDQAHRTTARGLAIFLASVRDTELARNGVWVHSFDSKHMPLVITNPAYARAFKAALDESNSQPSLAVDPGTQLCTCDAIKSETPDISRYFGSTDYNAGRHSLEKSEHRVNCLAWMPPTTGHLHSWRRSFED